MKKLFTSIAIGLVMLFGLCSCSEIIKEVPVEVIKTVEVPVETVVEKEVIVEKEVPVEVIVEKEVIKEVPVEVEKIVEVPVEVEKIVEKEVIKEVPVEVIVEKEVPVEVPGETVYVDKEVPVFDFKLLTYEADITTVGNKYQYMVVDNVCWEWNGVTGYTPCPATRYGIQAEHNRRYEVYKSNYRLSCWSRQHHDVPEEVSNLNSYIVPGRYYGEDGHSRPWYAMEDKRFILVNAEVTKVIESNYYTDPDGKPWYQCIVMYDYVIAL